MIEFKEDKEKDNEDTIEEYRIKEKIKACDEKIEELEADIEGLGDLWILDKTLIKKGIPKRMRTKVFEALVESLIIMKKIKEAKEPKDPLV